jgi:hypothetical protein
MLNNLLKMFCITCYISMFVIGSIFAQVLPSVRILFDTGAKRIDIITGKQLPNYTLAQQGSFQFFNGRLDKPDSIFWYYFDGRRNQDVNQLAFIRNMKSLGCWIIAEKERSGKIPNVSPRVNCEIEHHVISFIPLNPTTKQAEPRVYIPIEDLHLIQWAEYDHWLATDSQADIESKLGSIYW